MAIREIVHHNFIGHEINESIANYGKSDREIYCKKLHKITEPMAKDCDDCPYFEGFMQGYGHDCAWLDSAETDQVEKFIPHDKIKDEMMRVSQLIDDGYISKG